jgi:hypothetical protein
MLAILALLLAPLALAAPPSSPSITRFVFSGTGCPNDSGSVRLDTSTLGDYAGVSFTQLRGSDTDNCAVHITSAGGTPGWQVAVSQITYEGDVNLRGRSELDTYTQVFWSESAASTVCGCWAWLIAGRFLAARVAPRVWVQADVSSRTR